jgi:hypothetical protein
MVRAPLVLLGTAAYLGLAVLGLGGFAEFFSHPALIALVVVQLALSVMALLADGSLSPGVREDRANRWVIAAFVLIGLLAAYSRAANQLARVGARISLARRRAAHRAPPPAAARPHPRRGEDPARAVRR